MMNFAAEWFSHWEMKVLKGVSLLMSVCVREWQWQQKDILNDSDDLVWEELSEEWQKYVSEGGESPARNDGEVDFVVVSVFHVVL